MPVNALEARENVMQRVKRLPEPEIVSAENSSSKAILWVFPAWVSAEMEDEMSPGTKGEFSAPYNCLPNSLS
jgi:hypothetical protein